MKAALAALHEEEAALFGRAAKKDERGQEVGGQSRVILRVEVARVDVDKKKIETQVKSQLGIQYLLGQGLYHFRDGVLRDAILADGRFRLVLMGRPGRQGPTPQQWRSLEEALLVFGLLGGLGARARKGLGSISLQSLSGGRFQAPQSAADYSRTLRMLLEELPLNDERLPPFTAFSGASRLDISLRGGDAMSLLEKLGSEMQLYRSYGRDGKVGGRDAEQNFTDDHDEMLRIAQSGEPRRPPRRAVFGLPHNYFFSSNKSKVDVSSASEGDRRASPLFLHVHRLPDGQCLGVQLILPAAFLPASKNALKFKPGRGPVWQLSLDKFPLDWAVLHTLLDRFGSREALLAPRLQQPREVQV